MALGRARTSGKTLGSRPGEGSADLKRRLDRYTLRRAALAGVALVAFMAAVAGTAAGLQGEADPGVDLDLSNGVVSAVSPAGFAWRDGIRAGQTIVEMQAADEPGGWRLATSGGFVSDAGTAQAGLRESLSLGLVALAASIAALLLLRTRRRWVLPAASIGLLFASAPLAATGNAGVSTVALGIAVIVPASWAIGRLPGGSPKTIALGAGLAVFIAAWAAARLTSIGAPDTFESLRSMFAIGATGFVFLDRVVLFRSSGDVMPLVRPRPFDLAALAIVTGGTLAAVYLLAVPPLVIAIVAAMAVVAIPTLRRRLRPVENILLADVREQAAVEATERERGRLARELHDVPLQELFGVIRRLEVKPGTESESDDLRALASHLRNVAIDLRPPVLDDLGLSAALEYLAEGATTAERLVLADVVDHCGLGRTQRPPEEIELAMFRIAAEAIGNAIAHSGATEIVVRASVDPRRVELAVADNGAGLDPGRARAAARQQHMGLSSMRRRAEAVDADISITGSRGGTSVRAVWQA
jgi:signal transduction histidine kinase